MREQFTECANRALSLAEKKAKEYGTGYVGSEHLLLGLLLEPAGAAGMVLREAGVDLEKLLDLVDKLIVPEGDWSAASFSLFSRIWKTVKRRRLTFRWRR